MAVVTHLWLTCQQRGCSRHCIHFNGYRDRCPHIFLSTFLSTRGGYGLIMAGCRGVAGKLAAAARTRDAKHGSSATPYSYLSTAPCPGPSPRDMGVQEPAGVYAATGGWAHRWPSRPPPDLGAAEKKTQRPCARGFGGRDGVGVAGEAATAAYSLPLPFLRPSPVRPGDS